MSAKKVRVTLRGCDDCTTFEVDVPEGSVDFLANLVAFSETASDQGCQPTIHADDPELDRAVVEKLAFRQSGWSWRVLCEHGEGALVSIPFEETWNLPSRAAAEAAARQHGYEVHTHE